MSPPPPTGSTSVSSSGACSRISSATVPCPAITCGSSNAGTNVAPVSAASVRAWASCVVEALTFDDHVRAEHLGARHLRERRGVGHHDRGWYPEQRGVVGDALRVVPGRSCDHAPSAGVGIELVEEPAGAPLLEGGGVLKAFELAPHPGSGDRRERLRLGTRCAHHGVHERRGGRLDVRDRDRKRVGNHGGTTLCHLGRPGDTVGCPPPARTLEYTGVGRTHGRTERRTRRHRDGGRARHRP